MSVYAQLEELISEESRPKVHKILSKLELHELVNEDEISLK